MDWMWFIGGTWLVVGIALAVIIGRSIHLANTKAGHSEPAERPAGTVVARPTTATVVERRRHGIRRPASSPAAAARSPLMGGCVSPAARIPSEKEHGVL